VQDLYADDITMRIISADSELFDPKQLEEFFTEWIKEVPVHTGVEKRDRWVNAGIILNNSFALSNMQRHNINDGDRRAESKNQTFLGHINRQAAKQFSYFNDFMVGLKEQVGEGEFQRGMNEYLARFHEVVLSI
jgi:hypothetical protein